MFIRSGDEWLAWAKRGRGWFGWSGWVWRARVSVPRRRTCPRQGEPIMVMVSELPLPLYLGSRWAPLGGLLDCSLRCRSCVLFSVGERLFTRFRLDLRSTVCNSMMESHDNSLCGRSVPLFLCVEQSSARHGVVEVSQRRFGKGVGLGAPDY